jgi:hypothetical protein
MPSYKKFAVFALAASTVYPALAAPIRYEKLRFGSRSPVKGETMVPEHPTPSEPPQTPEGTNAPADPKKASLLKGVLASVVAGGVTAWLYNSLFGNGSSGPSAPSPGSGSGSAVLTSAVPPTVPPSAVPSYAVPPSTVLPSADPYAVPPSTVLPSANPSSVVPPSTVLAPAVPSPAASAGMKRTTETSESQPITEMEGRALGDYKLNRWVKTLKDVCLRSLKMRS